GLGCEIFQREPHQPRSLPDNRIRDLIIDSDKQLWVATYKALARFDEKQQDFDVFRKPSGIDHESLIDANCLLEDEQKNLWIGSLHGMFVFDRQREVLRRPKQASFTVLDTLEIKSLQNVGSQLWIGTERGLYVFDHESEALSLLQLADGKEIKATIHDILASQNAEVWLATERGVSLPGFLPLGFSRGWGFRFHRTLFPFHYIPE
ncbi:MAG: two-component regulator propeller domain-containing protein, partial [Bacteroidota bacterium]